VRSQAAFGTPAAAADRQNPADLRPSGGVIIPVSLGIKAIRKNPGVTSHCI